MIQAGSGKATAAGQAAQAGKGTNKENEGESARPAGNKTYLPVHTSVAQPPPALNTRCSFFYLGCGPSIQVVYTPLRTCSDGSRANDLLWSKHSRCLHKSTAVKMVHFRRFASAAVSICLSIGTVTIVCSLLAQALVQALQISESMAFASIQYCHISSVLPMWHASICQASTNLCNVFQFENSFITLHCRVVAAAAARGGGQTGAPSQLPAPANRDTRYLLLLLLSVYHQTSTKVE